MPHRSGRWGHLIIFCSSLQLGCVPDHWSNDLRFREKDGVLASVHIHAHRWRHYFATQLLSKGVRVSVVPAILGISTRLVEEQYSHSISSRQTAFDAALKGAWTKVR
jgi:integrase